MDLSIVGNINHNLEELGTSRTFQCNALFSCIYGGGGVNIIIGQHGERVYVCINTLL